MAVLLAALSGCGLQPIQPDAAFAPVKATPVTPAPSRGMDTRFLVTTSSQSSSELSGPLRLKRIGPEAAFTTLDAAPPTMDYAMPAPPPRPEVPPPMWTPPSLGAPRDADVLATEPLLIQTAPAIYGQPTPAVSLPDPYALGTPLPAVNGYVIGAGDTVQIDVLSRPELSAKGNVGADGRVTVALVGPVDIGGLTPSQAADRIAGAYRQGQYLVSPQVTVTMVDFQSQQITVLGEVRNPGRYAVRTRLSVLDGLALAGGVNEQGASTAYLLRQGRGGTNRYGVDLETLIQQGGERRSFPLQAGDTLLVPKAEVFYIYGEVKNPNAYKLKPGITVMQALSLAGGLTDKGTDKRIDIRRKAGDGAVQTVAANLNDPLRVDDVIYVRERLF
jgi:polysaccharide export outer membrane protein